MTSKQLSLPTLIISIAIIILLLPFVIFVCLAALIYSGVINYKAKKIFSKNRESEHSDHKPGRTIDHE
jgi:hypothetical protein